MAMTTDPQKAFKAEDHELHDWSCMNCKHRISVVQHAEYLRPPNYESTGRTGQRDLAKVQYCYTIFMC